MSSRSDPTGRESGSLARRIREVAERLGEARLMEVCGTHTVSLFRSGVRSLLPAGVRLISGPGCPVCVTSQGYIDAACALASRPEVTICTYGDMIRVPGRQGSLAEQRARGARVLVVYSARDALRHAEANRDRQVVFLAVGFETTAPATALTVLEARSRGLENFSVLSAHKLVVPAMLALLSADDVRVDGFLCPGHVSVVIGSEAYRPVAERHRRACVVAGFEPEQMLLGILRLLEQLARGEADVENVYSAAVSPGGNPQALAVLDRVFEPADAVWRAMGTIPASGLELRESYRPLDARFRFDLELGEDYDPPGCRCGEVIQGKVEPEECALFGTECTPARPVGPCMVSSEGTCAAWHKYGGLATRSRS
ncbi:MAG: hydrogenase formation protein HypD [Planctomycetes bacterium]|nr:hydrogenase formation protein HypD [Planctomycetota bacterium]